MRLFYENKFLNFVRSCLLLTVIFSLTGCAAWIAKPPAVILLPEERIFEVKAGQPINVLLDKKPLTMTFPENMFLVSSTVLVRQEEKLNEQILKNIKASAEKKTLWGIIGAILAIIAGIFSWIKKPIFPKKIEVK